MFQFKFNEKYFISIFMLGVVLALCYPFIKKGNDLEFAIEYLETHEKPDFNSFTDVKDKKKAFFDFFYPHIVNKNIKILELRNNIENNSNFEYEVLCKKYKLVCNESNYKNKLLSKINIIPASLALAQAANESAWGTSRFALKGNNYFGIWCFSKGCGLVPKGRSEGLKHEVRVFYNAYDSVSFYVDNINRNQAYKKLRSIRNKSLDSMKIVEGLSKYSERGDEYIKELKSMINFNKLLLYDEKMFNYLGVSY